MTEKFRKVVRTPEEAAKELRKFIEKRKPVEFVKDITKDKKPTKLVKASEKLGIAALGTLKGASWLAAGGAQFLLTLARWLTMDNVFLRNMEKKYASAGAELTSSGEKKLKLKHKYPNAYAHLLWWLLLAAISIGGYVGVEYAPDVVKKVQQKDKNIKFKDFKLDPNADADTWKKMVDAIHPYVLAHIISSEGFIEKAYDDNFGNGTLTIGSGFTISDAAHRNFVRKVLGRRLGNGSSISIKENQILVSEWLYDKVYPKIKSEIKKPIDADLFVMLAAGAYNKGSNIYANGNSGHKIAVAINKGKSKEEIVSAYLNAFCGIKGTQWSGLGNRFAVSALCYLGDVSDETILNAIAEAPYTLDQSLLIYNGKSRTARATGVKRLDNIEELLLTKKHRVTKGTAQKPVRNYLPSEYVSLIESGYVMNNGAALNYADFVNEDSKVKIKENKTDELNSDGEDLFFDKKYKQAAKKFEAAISENPENYIAYSNLAISYYKMDEYQKGLEVVQNLINSKMMKNMPDDIKGYTYYNAALCRMAMGDNARKEADKKNNYNMALKNLNLAKKFSGLQYSNVSETLKKKLRALSKTVSYNNAAKKLLEQDSKALVKSRLMTQNSEKIA